MSVELIPLCEIDITLRDPIIVGDGAAGNRLIIEVESAVITGDRLSGTMKGSAAADWVLVHGTAAVLDVRFAFETGDGAVVFAQYRGRMDLATGTVYVAPTFETGAESYAWLNTVQAVGKGNVDGSSLRYEWYEVR